MGISGCAFTPLAVPIGRTAHRFAPPGAVSLSVWGGTFLVLSRGLSTSRVPGNTEADHESPVDPFIFSLGQILL